MFLFLKLYLGHLIADFVLQFDELYRLKVKSRWGHVWHALTHGLVSAALIFPYLRFRSACAFLVAVSAVHYLQDEIKYAVQKDVRRMFGAFVIDQILHALVLSTVFLLPISRLKLGFPRWPAANAYYLDNYWTQLAILFLLATFGGSYLLHAFKKTYGHNVRPDVAITTPEMLQALVERTFFSFAVFFGFPLWAWAGLPLIALTRFLFKRTRSFTDFILSATYAAFLGFLFRKWVG